MSDLPFAPQQNNAYPAPAPQQNNAGFAPQPQQAPAHQQGFAPPAPAPQQSFAPQSPAQTLIGCDQQGGGTCEIDLSQHSSDEAAEGEPSDGDHTFEIKSMYTKMFPGGDANCSVGIKVSGGPQAGRFATVRLALAVSNTNLAWKVVRDIATLKKLFMAIGGSGNERLTAQICDSTKGRTFDALFTTRTWHKNDDPVGVDSGKEFNIASVRPATQQVNAPEAPPVSQPAPAPVANGGSYNVAPPAMQGQPQQGNAAPPPAPTVGGNNPPAPPQMGGFPQQ